MANQYEENPQPVNTPGNSDQKQNGANPDNTAARLLTEQDPFYPAFWENVIERSSNVPPGEEPAWWPIRVLFELDDLVTHRNMSTLSAAKAEMAAKLAPIHDSIKKIKTSYSIIAYPHSKLMQRAISSQVAHDQRLLQIHGTPRTQFELNDTELGILQRLCQTPRYTHTERDEHGRRYESPLKIIHPSIPFQLAVFFLLLPPIMKSQYSLIHYTSEQKQIRIDAYSVLRGPSFQILVSPSYTSYPIQNTTLRSQLLL